MAGIQSEVLSQAATQPAHAADRFAHEILAILECVPTRSRRLMRNPLAGHQCHVVQSLLDFLHIGPPLLPCYNTWYLVDGRFAN